jgi:hypothetical protein
MLVLMISGDCLAFLTGGDVSVCGELLFFSWFF